MQSAKIDRQTATERNSGIELLKVIAIILIVTSHVVQTLRAKNPYISYHDYMIDLSVATRDPGNFILTLFSYFGPLGNTVFFICSAWFLLRSSSYNKRKWFYMLFEIWFISIFILAVAFVIRQGDISGKILVKSLFPTTFANNWYLTCYLLFYPIHPLLNLVIFKLDQRSLFRVSAALFTIYCCLNFIKSDWFFPSKMILWVTVYFVIAYVQLHLKDSSNSVKFNTLLLIVGFSGYIGIALIANIAGLHVSYFHDKVLHWANSSNPFLIAITMAGFNFMRKIHFKNRIINYISSLSLLVYIIHENLILRTYFRPAMWNYVYHKYGYAHILLWVFALVLIVFLFGLVSAIVYDKTIRSRIRKLADSLYSFTGRLYLKAEKYMLKLR